MCGSVFKAKNTATLLLLPTLPHIASTIITHWVKSLFALLKLICNLVPSLCRSQMSQLSFLVHSELCHPCLLSAWVYQTEPPSRRICIVWPRSQQPCADWMSPGLLCLPDHLIVWVSFVFSPVKWAHLRVFSSLSNFPFFSFTPHKFIVLRFYLGVLVSCGFNLKHCFLSIYILSHKASYS